MFLTELTAQSELNEFVADHPDGQFLQSWEWGEFQKKLHRNIWRVGVYKPVSDSSDADPKTSQLIAVATVIEHTLGIGKSYLYCPYGPLFHKGSSSHQQQEALQLIMSKIRDITIKTIHQEEVFARIEPRITVEHADNFLLTQGFVKAQAMQPHDTLVIDVQNSEKALLHDMHHKARYNIRLAKKKGVTVRIAQEKKDLDIFWYLLQLTTARDNFHSHERSYYEALWESFHHTDLNDQMHLTVTLLVAEHDTKPIAASLLGLYGSRVTYLHGASNHDFRKFMAPQLLQWEGMLLAKKHGYQLYDFNGIKPSNRKLAAHDKEQTWDGITRFKKSFGGREVNYVGAWDWIYSRSWYYVYTTARKTRRLLPF